MKFTRIPMTVSITVILYSLLLSSCQSGKQETGSKPNILFIAVDDLNDWIGPLGGLEISKTPNLDKLAAQSI